jgi:hypothetical protein
MKEAYREINYRPATRGQSPKKKIKEVTEQEARE